MIYLLDTDITILLMRGLSVTKPANASQRMRQATGQRIFQTCRLQAAAGNVIALSAITVAELEYGACRSDHPVKERARMKAFLSPFALLDFDAVKAARWYGEVRSTLQSTGSLIGPNDLLIAAHALALGAVLVSNNIQEFQRITTLPCENWATAG